jgi:Polyketide cyclase / dehydrase and lipid transport
MEFRAQQELAVPPHVAFDLMADLRDQVEWSRLPSERELLTGEPVGLGSRFRAVHGNRPYEATITTYHRPERLGLEVRGSHLTIQGDLRFTPAGPGALLEAIIEIGAKGPMRLMLPTFRSTIAAELPKEAASFAQYCEARAGA